MMRASATMETFHIKTRAGGTGSPPPRNLGLTTRQTRTIAVGTLLAMLGLTVAPAAQAAVPRRGERGHTRLLNPVEMARIKGSVSLTQDHPRDGGAPMPWDGEVGDVSTATGNKQTDVPLVGWKVKGGRLSVSFALVHNSVSGYSSPALGAKWTHSYDLFLKPTPGTPNKVAYHQGDNATYDFLENVDGTFSAPTGIYDSLTQTGSGSTAVYTVTTKGQIKYQFASTDGVTWYCNQISDRSGNAISITRNASGQVTQVSDGSRALTFTYTSGKLTSVSDPLSRTWSLTYNGSGDLTQVAFPSVAVNGNPNGVWGYGYSFGLSGAFNPYTITNAGGYPGFLLWTGVNNYVPWAGKNVSSGTINGAAPGQFFLHTGDSGRNSILTFTAPSAGTYALSSQYFYGDSAAGRGETSISVFLNGNVASPLFQSATTSSNPTYSQSLSLSAGDVLSFSLGQGSDGYTYDTTPVAVSIVGSSSSYDVSSQFSLGGPTVYTEQFGYNAGHDITSLTDKRGKLWTFGYSGDSLTSETDPLNHGTSYVYTAPQTTITDANGHVTKHNYTSGRLTSVVDAGNYTESYGYDSFNNKTSITDKRGKAWGYTYDSRGNVLTQIDPLSHTTTTTYNSKNDPLTVTTHLGNATAYTYNTAGNLTGVSDPLSHATTFTVNAAGQVTQATDALSHSTSFGYDADGNQTTVTDALSHTTTTAYNTLGWPTSVTDAANNTVSTSYDSWGRATVMTAPGSRSTSIVYDASGNKTQVTDPLGKVTGFTYDEAGRLTSSTDPLSRKARYAYDNAGNKTGFSDGRGKVTSYAYTVRDQLSSISYPDGTGDNYTYNANGALATKTDGRGVTVTNTYDDAGRTTGVGYSDSTPSVSFAYDNDNRKTGMTDGTGTTSYIYDAASRLTSRTAPGTGVLSVGYGYDNANRLTSRTTAGTSVTTFGYDDANRMTTTTSPGGSGGLTTGYTFDVANRPLTTTFPNGVVETKSYGATTADLTSVVSKTSASGTTFDSHSYTYRADGRKSGETTPTASTSYSYDDAGQLVQEARTGTSAFTAGYTYDLAGNRLSKTQGSVTESYTYDDANKLTLAGSKSYTYDLAGNTTSVTSGGSTTYLTWDGAERLKSVGSDVYTYNGLGQRVKKVQAGSTFSHTVSDDSVDSDVLSDGAATYLHGARLIGETRGGTSKFYHADGLGTTRAVTNTSAATTDTLTTDAFGMTVASTGSTPTPFGFAGQHGYQSDSTGLMRLGHRFYDASTGRFLSRDPIQDGTNWYGYCTSDPVQKVDPEGMRQIPPAEQELPIIAAPDPVIEPPTRSLPLLPVVLPVENIGKPRPRPITIGGGDITYGKRPEGGIGVGGSVNGTVGGAPVIIIIDNGGEGGKIIIGKPRP